MRASRTLSLTLAVLLGAGAWLVAAAQSTDPPEPDRFVITAATPLTDADGVELGTLRIGAPASSVSEADGVAEVVIDGWSWADGPSLIFYALGQRIAVASLTEAGQAAREVLEPANDRYGVAWVHVRIHGTVAASALAPDLADVWAAAEQVKAEKCSVCHAEPMPGQLPVYRWPDRMRAERGRARLSAQEFELVMQYLQYHTP